MKSAYWAWGAVVADLGVFMGPLPHSTSTTAFVQVWVLHAGACAILATSSLLLMPAANRRGLLWTWLLLFCFAMIAPVLGALSILIITHTTLRRALENHNHAKPKSVALPEFEVRSQQVGRAGQGSIRSRLTSQVPSNVRMRSLLTLQAVPSRVANPILEELLGDDADDVRLIAFGMLDAEEKKLSVHIHREQKSLESPLSSRARYDCLRHLAELHWELIYAGLAHGGLKTHNLNQAWKYLEMAFAMDEQHECGILFLKGRILLAQGKMEQAREALHQSMQLGQSPGSALPYLADLAFQQREFAAVHANMQTLAQLHVASRTSAIVDLWTGRDSVLRFRDRRILQHI